ncbi:hypothetical protein AB0I27_28625 [Streptomyces sp. NPDC050597]|nr:hypothetical protein [Streptomyces sp. NBC_00258]
MTDAESDSYGGFIAALVLAAVAMGAWGSVRMSRWDRAYAAS